MSILFGRQYGVIRRWKCVKQGIKGVLQKFNGLDFVRWLPIKSIWWAKGDAR